MLQDTSILRLQLIKWRINKLLILVEINILIWSCYIEHMIKSLKQRNSLLLKCNIKLSYMTDKNFIKLRGIVFQFLIFLRHILFWIGNFIFRLNCGWNLSQLKLKAKWSTFLLIAFVWSFIVDLVFYEIQVYSLLVYFTHAVFLWRINFFHPWWLRVLMIVLIFSFFKKKIVKVLLR
jgi:hypothetical protein